MCDCGGCCGHDDDGGGLPVGTILVLVIGGLVLMCLLNAML